ncbi:S4 domain-containing protein [Immundisolibacter sp.]|uniref:RNA-binding S4 domain-containing protein n=1 Tax=Immundisolibacter sp. TaxID=1934948 RepID=UPI00260D7733|nr:S4 domain-containing protein [Immundisolibacter sp.]MDD3651418.1 S4 domain-containing protein [Immundisolibacter sp.]
MGGLEHGPAAPGGQRLDKWLWVSRLFRTRTLATEAVNGGKVRVNGQPAKPARLLKVGDEVSLLRGGEPMTVIVRGMASQRVAARDVAALYEETADSLARRQTLRAQRALTGPAGYVGKGRPDKRERRALQRLREQAGGGADPDSGRFE